MPLPIEPRPEGGTREARRAFRLASAGLILAAAVGLAYWNAAIKERNPPRALKPLDPDAPFFPDLSPSEQGAGGVAAERRMVIAPDFFREVRDQYPLRRVEGVGYLTVVESDLLGTLCNRVYEIGCEGLEAMAAPFEYEDFEKHPQRLRGAVLRVSGRLLRLDQKPLPQDAQCVVGTVWECTILDAGQRLYSLYALRCDEGLAPKRDCVEAAAVFFKNIRYPARGGGDFATPLLIAERLKKIPPPQKAAGRFEPAWILAAAGGTAILLFAFWKIERRRRQAFWKSVK